jgi:hypothetical protein
MFLSPYSNVLFFSRTVLTHFNQKRPISSDRTIFPWNILIFPDFKEFDVKLINMITQSQHWTLSRASSTQYTLRTSYIYNAVHIAHVVYLQCSTHCARRISTMQYTLRTSCIYNAYTLRTSYIYNAVHIAHVVYLQCSTHCARRISTTPMSHNWFR